MDPYAKWAAVLENQLHTAAAVEAAVAQGSPWPCTPGADAIPIPPTPVEAAVAADSSFVSAAYTTGFSVVWPPTAWPSVTFPSTPRATPRRGRDRARPQEADLNTLRTPSPSAADASREFAQEAASEQHGPYRTSIAQSRSFSDSRAKCGKADPDRYDASAGPSARSLAPVFSRAARSVHPLEEHAVAHLDEPSPHGSTWDPWPDSVASVRWHSDGPSFSFPRAPTNRDPMSEKPQRRRYERTSAHGRREALIRAYGSRSTPVAKR